ncbi:uncharacterized protein I303_106235 [Kwoniella dejecticola CBS 10117]|uniref:Uncharacterized protein n=1 Tax=Kwoniella dejecticola CBS 10117 TaxID=1296121 RepID=A0A1A6A1M9_9TREE|nr:uncharacterized protein I303_06254 [Kwoniella dejecticola CBS 10117]OBR83967.1 hypothetical protein I303_06254 [Kwoniella dejecticola CBS 10117]
MLIENSDGSLEIKDEAAKGIVDNCKSLHISSRIVKVNSNDSGWSLRSYFTLGTEKVSAPVTIPDLPFSTECGYSSGETTVQAFDVDTVYRWDLNSHNPITPDRGSLPLGEVVRSVPIFFERATESLEMLEQERAERKAIYDDLSRVIGSDNLLGGYDDPEKESWIVQRFFANMALKKYLKPGMNTPSDDPWNVDKMQNEAFRRGQSQCSEFIKLSTTNKRHGSAKPDRKWLKDVMGTWKRGLEANYQAKYEETLLELFELNNDLWPDDNDDQSNNSGRTTKKRNTMIEAKKAKIAKMSSAATQSKESVSEQFKALFGKNHDVPWPVIVDDWKYIIDRPLMQKHRTSHYLDDTKATRADPPETGDVDEDEAVDGSSNEDHSQPDTKGGFSKGSRDSKAPTDTTAGREAMPGWDKTAGAWKKPWTDPNPALARSGPSLSDSDCVQTEQGDDDGFTLVGNRKNKRHSKKKKGRGQKSRSAPIGLSEHKFPGTSMVTDEVDLSADSTNTEAGSDTVGVSTVESFAPSSVSEDSGSNIKGKALSVVLEPAYPIVSSGMMVMGSSKSVSTGWTFNPAADD